MANIISKLKKRTEDIQRRKKKRKEIMGEEGMIKQDMRAAQANIKAVFKKGDSVEAAKGRQARKRVGEYIGEKKQKARIKRMNTPLARVRRKQRNAASDKKSAEQFKKLQEAKQHKTNF